jgi:hypothetical protein
VSLTVVVILALATHRVWRLLAVDELPLMERFRCWITGTTKQPAGTLYVERPLVKKWLECPWCCGAWVSVAAYAAWRWGGELGEAVLVIAAAGSLVGMLVRNFDPQED